MNKKIRKVAFSFVITSALLLGTFVTAPATKTEAATNTSVVYKGNVTASALNVRNAGKATAKKIGQLKKNNVVQVVSTSKGWNKIKYGKGYGWVSGSYIKKQATPVAKKTTSAVKKTNFSGKVTASTLNVRSSSNAKSKRIGSLKKNKTVSVVETANGWYKIKYGKGYGWVSGSYITKVNTTAPSKTKPSTPKPAPKAPKVEEGKLQIPTGNIYNGYEVPEGSTKVFNFY